MVGGEALRWISAVLIFLIVNLFSTAALFGSAGEMGESLLGTSSSNLNSDVRDIEAFDYRTEVNTSELERPEKEVFMDQKTSLIDSAKVDVYGEPLRQEIRPFNYQLYRIENSYDYANRIKLVSDRESISENKKELILSWLAWKRASNQSFTPEEKALLKEEGFEVSRNFLVYNRQQLDESIEILAYSEALQKIYRLEHRQNLSQLVEHTEEINRRASTVKGFTSGFLNVVQEMRQTEVPGSEYLGSRTVWDAATLAAPSLETFVTSVETLDTELEEWRNASEQVNEAGNTLIHEMQEYENEDEMDYSSAGKAALQLESGLENYKSKTQELEQLLGGLQNGVEEIRPKTTDIPVLGQDLENALKGLSNGIQGLEDQIDRVQTDIEAQEDFIVSLQSAKQEFERRKYSEFNENIQVYDSWKADMITDEEAESRVQRLVIWLTVLSITSLLLLYKTLKSSAYLYRRIDDYLNPEPMEEKP